MEKISKGHNSIKNVSEVTVLVSAYCLMIVYICTKFHENILDSMKDIERTQFSKENFKGA